jgi:hypothetical protein
MRLTFQGGGINEKFASKSENWIGVVEDNTGFWIGFGSIKLQYLT